MSSRLELKNFLAGRGVVAALVLMLAAGWLAIEHGKRTIDRQREVLALSPRLQEDHLRKMMALHGGDAADGPGNLLYYLNFFTRREPSRFAPIAVGLRDVNPYNLKVRILALEGQLYDSEIGNPEAQALGNFDLTFLLTFLYPLLIVAFTHDVLSSEQESGTWDLIRSHPVARLPVLLTKAAVRFLPVPAIWLATVAAAVWRLGLPVDARLGYLIAVSLLYLLFWFGLAMLVAAWGRSSNFNALALLGAWLTLTILIPVALNLGIAAALPVSGAFEVALRQREGYHSKWDRPHQETLQAFYARYPEHAGYAAPSDKFSWGWYYAMQQMGDEDARTAALALSETMRQRERWSRRLAWAAPPALLQTAISRIAATGLDAHLAYVDSLRAFHEQVRRFFYPLLFRDPPIPATDWNVAPTHRFSDETQEVEFPEEIAILFAVTAAAIGFGFHRLARRL